MRREFDPCPDDREFLDKQFPDWESRNNGKWILLPKFSLPYGYTCDIVTAAIQMPSTYPLTQLDMVYFYPAALRKDGRAIRCTEATQPIDGLSYQRWSRHYKPGQWIAGESSLATHIMAIHGWLEKEVREVVAA